MPTFKAFEEVQVQKTPRELRSEILINFPFKDYGISDVESGIEVTNPRGEKLYVPNSIIQYYNTIYKDNMERKENFSKYLSTIDEMIQSSDLDEKTKKLKDMSKWFAEIEMNGENYSIIARLINNDKIDRSGLKTIYAAYASDNSSDLADNLRETYNTVLNDALYYLKFLIGVFTVLD